MAVATVASTTQVAGRRARRKRTSRSKAKAQLANRRRVSTLRAAAEHVLRQGKRTIDGTHDLTRKTRTSVSRRFARIRLPRRSDFRAITEINPLFLGAVGLGIGIILAAVVPRRISGLVQARPQGGRR